MEYFYITEYSVLCHDGNGRTVMAPDASKITAKQKKEFSTASPSDPFNAGTNFVRLISTADSHINFDGGAATANDELHPAKHLEFTGVKPGDTLSVYDGVS